MIPVLFSSLQVKTGCLDMTILHWADPYIFPGWRNHQFFYPLELCVAGQWLTIINIGEPLAGFDPLNTRLRILYVNQFYCRSGLFIVPVDLKKFFVRQLYNRFFHIYVLDFDS